jgi:hypothetical protein
VLIDARREPEVNGDEPRGDTKSFSRGGIPLTLSNSSTHWDCSGLSGFVD